MEFWGAEVKAGEPLRVLPELGKLIHISQATLGEVKDFKGAQHIPLRLKIDDKSLILGTLSGEERPQLMFELVLEKEFELSHDWKNGSVYFTGYTAENPTSELEDFSDDSDDEPMDALQTVADVDLATLRGRRREMDKRNMRIIPSKVTKSHVMQSSRDTSRDEKSCVVSDRVRGLDLPRTNLETRPAAGNKRKYMTSKSGEDMSRDAGEDARDGARRYRTDERVMSSSPKVDRLLVDGVNRKDNASSFWDVGDPEIGWRVGCPLVGDHDTIHLESRSNYTLTRTLASSGLQLLSLAKAFDFQGEMSRNTERNLREEVTSVQTECQLLLKKQDESSVELNETKKECDVLRRDLDKLNQKLLCEDERLRKDLEDINRKYAFETETGDTFLKSVVGQTLLTSTGKKAIEGYRSSVAFREDVIQRALLFQSELVLDIRNQLRMKNVPEEIVMSVEPDIPEPGSETIEVGQLTLGEILGDVTEKK